LHLLVPVPYLQCVTRKILLIRFRSDIFQQSYFEGQHFEVNAGCLVTKKSHFLEMFVMQTDYRYSSHVISQSE